MLSGLNHQIVDKEFTLLVDRPVVEFSFKYNHAVLK